jgi:uncharacterized delta-60 repeat protein
MNGFVIAYLSGLFHNVASAMGLVCKGELRCLLLLVLACCGLVGARVHAQPGALDLTFNTNASANSIIWAIALASDGKIVAGGSFTNVNGAPRRGVGRLLADGLLDTNFGPTVVDTVYDVEEDASNRVIIAGSFSTVNGASHTNIARLNADGTVDATFTPQLPIQASALGLQANGKIIVGGLFTNVVSGGVSGHRYAITRLNADGTDDGSFAGRGLRWQSGSGFCRQIAIQPDGKILVAGNFDSFDGMSVSNLVRLNEDTTLDTTFRTAFNGSASMMAVQPDGKLLIGGWVDYPDGITRGVARLHNDGTLDESFRTEAYPVISMALDSAGRIYIGGNYAFSGWDLIDGFKRRNIARLYPDGALDVTFDPGTGASASIQALALQADGNLVVAGEFTSFNNKSRLRIARVLGGSVAPAPPVIVIQPTNRTEYAGTWLDLLVGATGHPQPHFQWQFNGTNIPGATRSRHTIRYALSEHSGTYTATVSNELGVVITESAVLTVNSYPPGFLFQPTGQNLIEGQNLRMNVSVTGAPNPSVHWQLNGADATGRRQPLYAVTNATLADAGQYWAIASNQLGVATSQIAQVTITPAATNTGAVDISFVPQPPPWGPLSPIRAAIMQPDGKIVVGGDAGRVWRWLPDGQFDTSFVYTSGSAIEALALQPDGRILVGNSFNPRIVRLNPNGTPDPSFVPYSAAIYGLKGLVVQPDGKIVYAASAPSSGNVVILGRVLSNGAPDANFRTVTSPMPPGGASGTPVDTYGVLLQPDGKIVVASSLGGVVRYLPHGARDLSFTPFSLARSLVAFGMALRADGKLMVGWYGNSGSETPMVRLNEDGSRDASFVPPVGGGAAGSSGGSFYDVAIQPDGKILTVGFLTNRTRLMRLNPDGALDPNFARGEILLNPNPFLRLFVSPDCKPLVVGNFGWFTQYERPGAFRALTDLPVPPAITRQPGSVTVHRGQMARFSADVTCPPAPGYQWFFNDAPVANANQSRFTITTTETTDAGSYWLSVTNSLGSNQSSTVSLTVNPAPTNAGAVDVDFMAAAPNDSVLAAIRQPDGKLIIAGHFTKVGTNDRACVARLNTDGSIDATFDAGVITNTVFGAPPQPASVGTLALQADGRILIGGTFSQVAAGARRNLARLHGDGALDTSFINGSISSSVLALAMQGDGKILVSQSYYSPSLLRLNTNGGPDSTFQYPVSLSPNRTIKSIVLQSDGRILIAGDFTSISGAARTGLARLLTNGLVDNTLADIQAPVDTMAVLPDAIVVGGSFNTIRGLPQRYLAAISYSGVLMTNIWREAVNQPVQLLVKDSCDRILAAGAFTNAGSSVVRGLRRFLTDGQADPTFSPPIFNSSVRAIAMDDAHILAAGDFTEINGCYRPGVARLFESVLTVPVFVSQPTNITTVMGRDLALSAAVLCPPGTVFQWQLNGTDIIGATTTTLTFRNARAPQAGAYQLVASNQFGMTTSVVATVTLSPAPTKPGDNDIEFYPDLTNAQRVAEMALQSSGKLLVAHSPGTPRTLLQRYNRDGTRDETFTPVTLEATALAVGPADEIYITAIQGSFVRLHPDGGTTNFVVSYPGGFFYDLALQPDGKVILLGRFASLPTAHRARRFNNDGSIDTTFAVLNFDHQVSCGALQSDGKVLIGGGFTNVDTARSPFVARLNGNGTRDSNFISGFTSNAWVYALAAQDDGRIIAAGSFTNYAGQRRRNIVRLHATGAPDTTFAGDLSGPASRLAIQRDGKVLVAGSQTMQAGNQTGIVRLLANGAPDPTFESGPIVWNAGAILELLLAPDGDIYIGNGFISYDGFTRYGFVRLHGNPVMLGPTYSSGSFSTSMFTDLGRTYHLESAASLANPVWGPVETVIGNGAVQIFGDSPAGTTRYYRIRAE